MTHIQENTVLLRSTQQLPCLSRNLEGLFELDGALKGPQFALCVASRTTEIQGHCLVCRSPRTVVKNNLRKP